MKLGFIGIGNMGGAILQGVMQKDGKSPIDVYVFDLDQQKMNEMKTRYKINLVFSEDELIQNSDLIILAVKPQYIKETLLKCKKSFSNTQILVTVAVGVPISAYENILGNDKKIVRTMPNTPALVGEAMTLMCYGKNVSQSEKLEVKGIFECFGIVEDMDEKLLTECTALTGSSPAYVYIMIEAMADAAVLSGIPRDIAYKLAAQAVLGSAKMVLDTGIHPAKLKDSVCSPGGTTIRAVEALERKGFRSSPFEAMNECTKRAKEIENGGY